MWNPIKYNCKCNKACKIEKYLDIKIVHAKNVYLINQYQHVKMEY